MPKKITIHYFASLRESAGINTETVETDAALISDLFAKIKKKYGFNISLNDIKFAINDEFCAQETPLKAGDVIYFMPPVSGG